MPVRCSPARRAGVAALGLVATVSAGVLAGLDPAATRTAAAELPAARLPDSLALDVHYAGVGAEAMDLIWRGDAEGSIPGQVTVRMEYAGPPAERRMPVWPVNVWLFYSADDLRSSFAAELSGSMNWRTGDLRVTGLVSDGLRVGTAVEQRMRVERSGLAARVRVRFLSGLASVR